MVVSIILFVVGLVLLIKGADLLVDGASALARKSGISELVIGLTIVAFGTSLPELVVNLIASVNGNSEIAIGNIVGSNIANVLLILGCCALIFPLQVQRNTTYKEIPFAFLAACVLLFLAADRQFSSGSASQLTLGDGLTLLSFFAIFMYYIINIARSDTPRELPQHAMGGMRIAGYLILGIAGLIGGGKLMVDAAVSFATNLGVSQRFIGLTIVAIGTSLPELATSTVATWKRNSDIAIGNVVGSNIFNTFWILGVSALIRPLPIPEQTFGDLLVNVVVSALLFFFVFLGQKHKLERWQGVAFLILYIVYVCFLTQQG